MPLAVAVIWYRQTWQKAFLLLLSGLVIDLDHLWATPVYDPTRCSIGCHPLHGVIPIILYGLLFAVPKTRIIGLGLLLHVGLDAIDCVFNVNI